MEATQIQERSIKVKRLYTYQRKTISCTSIKEAISEVKEHSEKKPTDSGKSPSCQKIILDGEIVYNSNRNGKIEDWEKEWKRQKKVISVDKEAHNCRFDNESCYEDSLCSECKMNRARKGARDTS